MQKSQNQGIKAVAIPEINWIKTATTNGMRRPTLIENLKKKNNRMSHENDKRNL